MALFGKKVRQVVLACVAAALLAPRVTAIELKPGTAAAFDHYIHATEGRMTRDLTDGRFLIVDTLPETRREQVYMQLRQGQPTSHNFTQKMKAELFIFPAA